MLNHISYVKATIKRTKKIFNNAHVIEEIRQVAAVIAHFCDATFSNEVAVGAQATRTKWRSLNIIKLRESVGMSALCRGHNAVNHGR